MSFVWRSLWRELRSGELRLLFAALVVAVAAVTAVSFVGDRVRNALQREAQQMMGGDLIVIGDVQRPARGSPSKALKGCRDCNSVGKTPFRLGRGL